MPRPIRQSDAGCCDGGLEHERRIDAGVGTFGQLDLTVVQHDTGSDRPIGLADRASIARFQFSSHSQAMVRPAAATSAIIVVGVAPAAGRGDRVLVLEPHHLAGAIGRQVQRDPGAQQRVVARSRSIEVLVDDLEPARHRPPHGLHVAQPTVAVLQVGLEPVGDVGGLGLPRRSSWSRSAVR